MALRTFVDYDLIIFSSKSEAGQYFFPLSSWYTALIVRYYPSNAGYFKDYLIINIKKFNYINNNTEITGFIEAYLNALNGL